MVKFNHILEIYRVPLDYFLLQIVLCRCGRYASCIVGGALILFGLAAGCTFDVYIHTYLHPHHSTPMNNPASMKTHPESFMRIYSTSRAFTCNYTCADVKKKKMRESKI
jgi:hypothetical protein